MKDNLEKLSELFTVDVDEVKYAGGWAYLCRKCNLEAHSIEAFFPCQGHFVPVVVLCNECRARWALKIEPESGELGGLPTQ